jgi:hypothetical protein
LLFLSGLFGPCDSDGFLCPVAEAVAVFEDIDGDFVVGHDGRFVLERPEGLHAGGLVVGAIGVIDLEVQDIVGDDGEEQVLEVDADAAKHPLGLDAAQARELVGYIGQIVVGNRQFASFPMN